MRESTSYLASVAHSALAGIATNDAMLIRVLMPRTEVTIITEANTFYCDTMPSFMMMDLLRIRVVTIYFTIFTFFQRDLIDIKKKYKEKYGNTLMDDIDGKCQSKYKYLLLTLIDEKYVTFIFMHGLLS